MKAAKNHEQSGPELLKWLDDDDRICLLDLINGWWTKRKAPKALFAASVVPIYKTRDAHNVASYVQFHFLSSICKIFMIMILCKNAFGDN